MHADDPSFILSLSMFTYLVIFAHQVHSGTVHVHRVPPAPDPKLREGPSVGNDFI